MKQVLSIAASEWRYWLRSQLSVSAFALFVLLLVTTSIVTAVRMQTEQQVREQQQQLAEQTFLAQPDRHPHRMVHYGHYVYRSTMPLAVFDPGLDPVTGQSIFLEGHRQNTAMFAHSDASTNLGGLAWLTPALVYQLFAPLLIILLGHSAIAREREAKLLIPLLAQGLKPLTIIYGKSLALLSFASLLLLPLVLSALYSLYAGEKLLSVVALIAVYFVYLVLWCLFSILLSVLIIKRSSILTTLTVVWLTVALVLPSMAVTVVSQTSPLPGKIATDLSMLAELRKLGDGHNANDPAFARLRDELLKQYQVDSVEQLPVNFRGLVAKEGEEKLTEVLVRYAEQRMQQELKQAKTLQQFAWLSPSLAVAFASRAISATDLQHYHQFLRQAEELRYNFVQGLNSAHVEKLSYQDDINRNKDKASWLRARVDASNWQVLDNFRFDAADSPARLRQASYSISIMLSWLAVILCVLFASSRSLKP
ncbi:DUF3526 domain-containing protein [Agaribacterium haliotis]|uniref:DUF3526 domain-containing protein n=1 Tax=Agaribacterium haliotis TaxID=2013869 RepID=UPI000BB53787|nr:DUF3526 domain-containing protein [Agaribacterium haliotis]